MLRLMLDLRRPHLSKTLDPDGVAEQLSAGLPQIDESLMRRLAGGLEQIETLEHGLARLRDVRERARRFHQRDLRCVHAGGGSRASGRRCVSRRRRSRARRRIVRGVRAALEDTGASGRRSRGAAREAARRTSRGSAAEEHAIISSASWSSVAEVEALRGGVEGAAWAAARAARDHADRTAASAASALEAELITARAGAADRGACQRAEDELTGAEGLADQAEPGAGGSPRVPSAAARRDPTRRRRGGR